MAEATASATFINPPPFGAVGNYEDLPSYGFGTMLTVRWTTNAFESEVWLLQDGDGSTCEELNLAKMTCVQLATANRGQSWNWPIQEPAGYDISAPVYYLSLQDPSSRQGFGLGASHYMNLLPQSLLASPSTSPSPSPSSSLSPSSSPSPSSLPSPSLSPSPSPTTTTPVVVYTPPVTSVSTTGTTLFTTNTPASSSSSTPVNLSPTTSGSSSDTTLDPVVPTASSTPAPAGGTSGGTKVAIGAAVGVGVPLIIILAVIAFFLYRNHTRKRNTANHSPSYNGNTDDKYYIKQPTHNMRPVYDPRDVLNPEPVPMHQNYQPTHPRAELSV